MDLFPATQALDDEEYPATQQITASQAEKRENVQIGELRLEDKTYPVFSGTTTIGRHPSCKINISHETISKKHAEIEANETTAFIKDLKSCNKTKINSLVAKPMVSYQIKNNDKIIFGKIVATFKTNEVEEESLMVPPSPQNSKKANNSIIPDTPDVSMNGSDLDLSSVPSSQREKPDSIFRRPQIPPRTPNTNVTKRSNNLNASYTPNKSLDPITDPSLGDTVRYNSNETDSDLENLENNSFNQNINNSSLRQQQIQNETSYDDIYDMETQRPDLESHQQQNHLDSSKETNDSGFENLETQQFDISGNKNHHNHHVNNSVGVQDLETQQFDHNDLQLLETQEFVKQKSNSRQSNKNLENQETQRFESVESLDPTTNFELALDSTQATESKTDDENISDLDTQVFKSAKSNLDIIETQQFVEKVVPPASPRRSSRRGISTPADSTQQFTRSPRKSDSHETQQFEPPSNSSTPRRASRRITLHSNRKDLENFETQQFEQPQQPQPQPQEEEKMENMSTQQFVCPDFDLENIETQPFETDPIEIRRAEESAMETQQFDKSNNSRDFENCETQRFDKVDSSKTATPNAKIQHLDNVETQPFTGRETDMNKIVIADSEEFNEKILEAVTQQFNLDNSIYDKPTQKHNDSLDDSIYSKATQKRTSLPSIKNSEIAQSSPVKSKITTPKSNRKSQPPAEEPIEDDYEEVLACSQSLLEGIPNFDEVLSATNLNVNELDHSSSGGEEKNSNKVPEPSEKDIVVVDSDNETDDDGIFQVCLENLSKKSDKTSPAKSITNNPVPNGVLTISDDSDLTDEEGVFTISAISVGSATKSGRKESEVSNIILNIESDEEDLFDEPKQPEPESSTDQVEQPVAESGTDEEGIFEKQADKDISDLPTQNLADIFDAETQVVMRETTDKPQSPEPEVNVSADTEMTTEEAQDLNESSLSQQNQVPTKKRGRPIKNRKSSPPKEAESEEEIVVDSPKVNRKSTVQDEEIEVGSPERAGSTRKSKRLTLNESVKTDRKSRNSRRVALDESTETPEAEAGGRRRSRRSTLNKSVQSRKSKRLTMDEPMEVSEEELRVEDAIDETEGGEINVDSPSNLRKSQDDLQLEKSDTENEEIEPIQITEKPAEDEEIEVDVDSSKKSRNSPQIDTSRRSRKSASFEFSEDQEVENESVSVESRKSDANKSTVEEEIQLTSPEKTNYPRKSRKSEQEKVEIDTSRRSRRLTRAEASEEEKAKSRNSISVKSPEKTKPVVPDSSEDEEIDVDISKSTSIEDLKTDLSRRSLRSAVNESMEETKTNISRRSRKSGEETKPRKSVKSPEKQKSDSSEDDEVDVDVSTRSVELSLTEESKKSRKSAVNESIEETKINTSRRSRKSEGVETKSRKSIPIKSPEKKKLITSDSSEDDEIDVDNSIKLPNSTLIEESKANTSSSSIKSAVNESLEEGKSERLASAESLEEAVLANSPQKSFEKEETTSRRSKQSTSFKSPENEKSTILSEDEKVDIDEPAEDKDIIPDSPKVTRSSQATASRKSWKSTPIATSPILQTKSRKSKKSDLNKTSQEEQIKIERRSSRRSGVPMETLPEPSSSKKSRLSELKTESARKSRRLTVDSIKESPKKSKRSLEEPEEELESSRKIQRRSAKPDQLDHSSVEKHLAELFGDPNSQATDENDDVVMPTQELKEILESPAEVSPVRRASKSLDDTVERNLQLLFGDPEDDDEFAKQSSVLCTQQLENILDNESEMEKVVVEKSPVLGTKITRRSLNLRNSVSLKLEVPKTPTPKKLSTVEEKKTEKSPTPRKQFAEPQSQVTRRSSGRAPSTTTKTKPDYHLQELSVVCTPLQKKLEQISKVSPALNRSISLSSSISQKSGLQSDSDDSEFEVPRSESFSHITKRVSITLSPIEAKNLRNDNTVLKVLEKTDTPQKLTRNLRKAKKSPEKEKIEVRTTRNTRNATKEVGSAKKEVIKVKSTKKEDVEVKQSTRSTKILDNKDKTEIRSTRNNKVEVAEVRSTRATKVEDKSTKTKTADEIKTKPRSTRNNTKVEVKGRTSRNTKEVDAEVNCQSLRNTTKVDVVEEEAEISTRSTRNTSKSQRSKTISKATEVEVKGRSTKKDSKTVSEPEIVAQARSTRNASKGLPNKTNPKPARAKNTTEKKAESPQGVRTTRATERRNLRRRASDDLGSSSTVSKTKRQRDASMTKSSRRLVN